MNQHPVNLRLPLLLEDIKIKSLTDRPCAHTDLLIEKALKDEKFKKTLDDSDWSSIGILQNEIKQASNVLKDMDWKRKKASSYNPEIVKIPDNMTKLQKLEKELREKNKIINDLKKRNNELEKIAVELNCDK